MTPSASLIVSADLTILRAQVWRGWEILVDRGGHSPWNWRGRANGNPGSIEVVFQSDCDVGLRRDYLHVFRPPPLPYRPAGPTDKLIHAIAMQPKLTPAFIRDVPATFLRPAGKLLPDSGTPYACRLPPPGVLLSAAPRSSIPTHRDSSA